MDLCPLGPLLPPPRPWPQGCRAGAAPPYSASLCCSPTVSVAAQTRGEDAAGAPGGGSGRTGGRSTLIPMFPWTLRRRYQHGVPSCSGSSLRGRRSVQGRLEGGVRSRGLRVRIQGRIQDPGGVSAHGYLEGYERSARSGSGHPAAAPHLARGSGDHWNPRDRGFRATARRRVRARAAGCLASCGGPRTGTRTVGAPEACELHLNGRPAGSQSKAGGGLGSRRGPGDWRRAKAAGPRSSVLQSVASAP